ncbi:hypothetical protein C8F04DRAFT_1063251 [Mycena alexandri]|uniref:Zn(2)-C6 fungal-type domain-containing protein n=1 Tax=Mycena alexandri TaxID=1745969 RepID=A0AAD6XDK0_9AGAR|nr:hypothetical protein C8F04DRAFT_1063251 [Mycena alexandri]
MSTLRIRQKRVPKPPACDTCKAKRVLCHPQPNGAPCPRCVDKNNLCTTTPTRRGRPAKNPEPARMQEQELAMSQVPTPNSSSSMTFLSPRVLESFHESLELTPEIVEHFFDCFERLSSAMNPIVLNSSVKRAVQTAAFRISLLPPETRVLALVIVALGSLISFHESVLGPGPRPASHDDVTFFASGSHTDVINCGPRRARTCRALHAAALKAAWDTGIILNVSTENAASCFLLDTLDEQSDFSKLSRPWANAYISHIRVLATLWRKPNVPPPQSANWAGFLMAETLLSARRRKPILVTMGDQILLSGAESRSLEQFLASIEASAEKPGSKVLFDAMKPYAFHVTHLARELWETIIGDHVRLAPLSESAVTQFISSISLVYAVLTRLLSRVDTLCAASSGAGDIGAFSRNHEWSEDRVVRGCAYGIIMGFVGLVLPLHRELEYRVGLLDAAAADVANGVNVGATLARERLGLLAAQARVIAALAIPELARAIRLPRWYYAPIQVRTLADCVRFALDEAEAAPVLEPERVKDLATIGAQLRIVGYSLDLLSSPETAQLLARLERYTETPAMDSYFSSGSIDLASLESQGLGLGRLEDFGLPPLDHDLSWVEMELDTLSLPVEPPEL